jgi:geranylgeranyl diphosphate synthase type II
MTASTLTCASVVGPTSELAAAVDGALDRYLSFSSDCPDRLAAAMRYSVQAPGKRLRPSLVLLAAEACGGEGEAALPAAAAVELVHAYSLIHDDLPAMDDDDLRRGRPTCHKQFGEALAILAGDALLALAFEIVARDIQPPDVAARCCAELGRAAGATALVGGQADDLDLEFRGGDLAAVEAVHRRKTGAMILASLRLGGFVAGADATQLACLDVYGQALGLAFQIVDDVLDVAGDEAALGKRVGKDAGRGKLTFPALLGMGESRRRAAALVDDAVRAIAPLGGAAAGLEALARYVLDRNR